MKMISSTSITSTSGTTLISASELATRRPRLRPGAGPAAAGCTLGISGEVPFRDVEELHGEIVHFRGEQLHFVRQRVIEVDGRNRREESGRRRDERIGNPRRDHA